MWTKESLIIGETGLFLKPSGPKKAPESEALSFNFSGVVKSGLFSWASRASGSMAAVTAPGFHNSHSHSVSAVARLLRLVHSSRGCRRSPGSVHTAERALSSSRAGAETHRGEQCEFCGRFRSCREADEKPSRASGREDDGGTVQWTGFPELGVRQSAPDSNWKSAPGI